MCCFSSLYMTIKVFKHRDFGEGGTLSCSWHTYWHANGTKITCKNVPLFESSLGFLGSWLTIGSSPETHFYQATDSVARCVCLNVICYLVLSEPVKDLSQSNLTRRNFMTEPRPGPQRGINDENHICLRANFSVRCRAVHFLWLDCFFNPLSDSSTEPIDSAARRNSLLAPKAFLTTRKLWFQKISPFYCCSPSDLPFSHTSQTPAVPTV